MLISMRVIKGPSDDVDGMNELHTPLTSTLEPKFKVHFPRPWTVFTPFPSRLKARMPPK